MHKVDTAIEAAYAATRPQPRVVDTITDRRWKTRDILYYPIPPFLAPASNGNREVARRARQIAAGKLRVTHVD